MGVKVGKKAYDRERQRRIYEDFKVRRVALFVRLGNKCFKCGKSAKPNFHLHHDVYHPTESNYPRNGKTMSDRLKRLKEAEEHPERFLLLCGRCHGSLELEKYRQTSPF